MKYAMTVGFHWLYRMSEEVIQTRLLTFRHLYLSKLNPICSFSLSMRSWVRYLSWG